MPSSRIFVTLIVALCHMCLAVLSDNFTNEFLSPPIRYGPHVFYHWINGNIRKAALAKDLDAMVDAGYGGALILDVNAGIPQGDILYGSDEWLDLLTHTVQEMEKRGQLAAMHNAPGYSGIGSTELPLNQTMKQLVWTETRINSNDSTGKMLQKPFTKLGIYEDLYTLAYPALLGEGTVFREAVAAVSINGAPQNTTIFNFIDRGNPIRLKSQNESLVVAMKTLYMAQAIALYRLPETPTNAFDGARDFPPSWSVQISNDSLSWSNVATAGTFPALREMDAPSVLTFAPVVAKYFRLQPSGPSWVIGLDISSSARLPNWAVKSHGAAGTISSNPAVVPNVTASINSSTIIDVTKYLGPDGDLDWVPHEGTYTVVRLGYTLTGQEMPATPDSQTPALSVDLFSKDAIDAHFDTHLDRVITALKPYIPETFYGLEIDSYELGQQNWGGQLESDFLDLRGYSLNPWILAATGRVLDSAMDTEKFLYDLRLTHANLVATNCYGYFQQRLTEHGLQLLIEPYGDGPFDSMELAGTADLAYGEFWAHHTYGSDGYSSMGLSSAGEKGIELVPSEAFTGQPTTSKWTEFPYNLKGEGDRIMAFGINRWFLHTFVHQPVDEAVPGMTFGPFGTHFDRMNTWTKQASGWSQYVSRVSYMMQNTRHIVDIGCFIGDEASASPPITYNSPYAVPLYYQADVFSRSNLLLLTPKDGKACYASGLCFSLLVFPDMPSASAQTLSHIIDLAIGGVPVLLLGTNPPKRSIGRINSDADVVQLGQKLWGMKGTGVVFIGNTTDQVANLIGIKPHLTFTATANNAAIYYIHKSMDDGSEMYFVTNNLRESFSAVLSLRGAGVPEIWNAMDGKVSSAAVSSISGDRTLISYSFGPLESVLIRLKYGEIPSPSSITSIARGNTVLYSTVSPSALSATQWAGVSSSFTIIFWAKPEVYQFGTTGYVFYPTGAAAYGAKHALSSVAMGCNGIQLLEATTSAPVSVLSLTTADNNFSISGWTHFAISYEDNQPSLYVNGKLAATGTKSAYTVHPGLDTPDSTAKMNNRFVGDLAGLQLVNNTMSPSDIESSYNEGLPIPKSPLPVSLGANNAMFREDGNYTIETTGNKSITVNIEGTASLPIDNSWTVTLPRVGLPASRANSDLTFLLDRLESLKDHSDFDVAHFSGTAKYTTHVNVPQLSSADLHTRYILNLGRVENIAHVIVNNQSMGISWAQPYELDVTSAILVGGDNILVVEVTNCWPNRLIGDEQLPAEATYNSTIQDFAVEAWPDWFEQGMRAEDSGNSTKAYGGSGRKPGERVTFSSWKHYNNGDPLFESGLLGPVTLIKAKEIVLT
ncbi:putative F5/8 type C domain-containing protein [Seiridium unicorne]|uniref:F5/8 type C domain-containing protein n=1 Tax=Seiridium unicorne TaxID=138068 RepID=A0ABR2UJ17_9PEZI